LGKHCEPGARSLFTELRVGVGKLRHPALAYSASWEHCARSAFACAVAFPELASR
jgi:hypothetical protein